MKTPLNPSGYCECGCGEKTRVATSPNRNTPVGHHYRFIRGHHMNNKSSIQELFWSKVAITADVNKCWEWQASFLIRYGSFKANRKTRAAHKVAWELTHGEIPNGLWVLHTCDNAKCVNPNHLYLGTSADNVRDRVERDRGAKGERQPNHKLTNVAVVEIRRKHAFDGVAIRALAREYNVSQKAIQLVVRGKTWKPKCQNCNDISYLSIRNGCDDQPCPVCNPVEMEVTF